MQWGDHTRIKPFKSIVFSQNRKSLPTPILSVLYRVPTKSPKTRQLKKARLFQTEHNCVTNVSPRNIKSIGLNLNCCVPAIFARSNELLNCNLAARWAARWRCAHVLIVRWGPNISDIKFCQVTECIAGYCGEKWGGDGILNAGRSAGWAALNWMPPPPRRRIHTSYCPWINGS